MGWWSLKWLCNNFFRVAGTNWEWGGLHTTSGFNGIEETCGSLPSKNEFLEFVSGNMYLVLNTPSHLSGNFYIICYGFLHFFPPKINLLISAQHFNTRLGSWKSESRGAGIDAMATETNQSAQDLACGLVTPCYPLRGSPGWSPS